ncbi:MAG: helix-turn-helix domain-containing protein [Prevotellaceae bacterium]|jgi:transcriptional regulator with XRE-family HTH domain|nr:helix-turn-helix domain-containing protein [Prevotellaceae bacterium]
MNNKKIREIRENLDFSQEKFAEMLGVTLRTVQNYESGGVIPQSKIPFLQMIEKQIEIGNTNEKNVKILNDNFYKDKYILELEKNEQLRIEIRNLEKELFCRKNISINANY